jgi:hypothetical protein
VALRLQLWLDLPLSQHQLSYDYDGSQFWDVPIDVAFGSVAALSPKFSSTAAFAREADDSTLSFRGLAAYRPLSPVADVQIARNRAEQRTGIGQNLPFPDKETPAQGRGLSMYRVKFCLIVVSR